MTQVSVNSVINAESSIIKVFALRKTAPKIVVLDTPGLASLKPNVNSMPKTFVLLNMILLPMIS